MRVQTTNSYEFYFFVDVNITNLYMESPFSWSEEVEPNDVSPVDQKLLIEKLAILKSLKTYHFLVKVVYLM